PPRSTHLPYTTLFRSLKRADIGHRLNVFALETFVRVLQQVADLPVDERPDNGRLKLLGTNLLMATLDLLDSAGPKFDFLEFCQTDRKSTRLNSSHVDN